MRQDSHYITKPNKESQLKHTEENELMTSSENSEVEIALLWELYKQCEKQFIEFNDIVPYKNNPMYVNSPKLVMLLQSTCIQIEQCQKLLIKIFLNIDSKGSFLTLIEHLNKKHMLSIQEVILYDNKEVLKPFADAVKRKTPEWWYGYNQAKHQFLKGRFFGTIGETLNALGALFILNRIAGIIKDVGASNVFDSHQWSRITPDDRKFSESIWKARNSSLRHSQIFFHPFVVSDSQIIPDLIK